MIPHHSGSQASKLIQILHHITDLILPTWRAHHTKPATRLLHLTLFLTLSLILTVTIVLLRLLLTRIHLHSYLTFYDLGLQGGLAPRKTYASFADHTLPDIEILQWDERCGKGDIYLAPRGPQAAEPGGVILSAEGELVWRQHGFGGDVQDFRVQEYRGEMFLTFWAGEEDKGRKIGFWYMLDETYTTRFQLAPVGDYEYGDMHEFLITKDNTALISIYQPTPADLSSIGGAKEGFLLNCIFQELNIATGSVVFEWDMASHIPLNMTNKPLDGCSQSPSRAFGGCGDRRDAAFDPYHMNSVDKDERGNYLVSGRNTAMLSYIDGVTGEVIWNLGGGLNEFEDLSGGAATSFKWQHDARLHMTDNKTSISLFDNQARQPQDEATGEQSCGLIIDLSFSSDIADTNQSPNYSNLRTAKLKHAYCHPHPLLAYSQGNLQVQPDTGNVFIGWGHNAGFTEFSAEGDVLCDARFGASAWSSFGGVTSYRVFRGEEWVGKPVDSRLSAVMDGGRIYVSWNGATEVAVWAVEGVDLDGVEEDEEDGDDNDEDFEVVTMVSKTGFETEISLLWEDNSYDALRVIALDKGGNILGKSALLDCSKGKIWPTPLTTVYLALLGMVLGVVTTFWTAWRCCQSGCCCLFGRRERNSRSRPSWTMWRGETRVGGYELVHGGGGGGGGSERSSGDERYMEEMGEANRLW